MLLNGKSPKQQPNLPDPQATPPGSVPSESVEFSIKPLPPPTSRVSRSLPGDSVSGDLVSESSEVEKHKMTSSQPSLPKEWQSGVNSHISHHPSHQHSDQSPHKRPQEPITSEIQAKRTQRQLQQQTPWKEIALGILPVLLFGTVGYMIASQSVARKIAETKQAQAIEVSAQLDRYMYERFNDIEVLAQVPLLRHPKLREATTLQEQQKLIEQLKATYSIYDSITVLDLNGQVMLQTAGSTLTNPRDRGYFQAVLKTNRPTIGTPEISPATGLSVLPIAATIQHGETGETIAVIATTLPLTELNTLIQQSSARFNQQPGSQSHVYAFDRSGKILASNDPKQNNQRIHQRIDELIPKVAELRTKSEPEIVISSSLTNGMTLVQSVGQSIQLSVRQKAVPVTEQSPPPSIVTMEATLIGFAPTSNHERMPHLDWGVVATAAAMEVVSAQQNLAVLLALGTLGTAGIIVTIAASTAKRTTQCVQDDLQSLQDRIQTLEQKQQRSLERSRLLSEIVNNMRQSLRQEDILNTAVSELRYALNTDRVIVYFFQSDWSGKVSVESVGLGWRKILGESVNDPFREGMIERYKNGRVRVMNDIYTENLTQCHQNILEDFQIRASIVAPILQNDRLIGLLCAHHCAGPRYWEEEDINLFAKLSSQLGYVLDQVALLQKQTRNADRSKLLNEIVSTMRRSLREEDILNTTVSELRYALHTERVIVYKFDDDWNGTIIAESVALGWQKILGKTVHDPFQEGLIDRYKNGHVRSMNNIYTENLTQCHQELLENFQIKASIVAPILQNGKLTGLLCAHHCSAPRNWEEVDVDLFAKLSTQLGFALDQAALLRKQIRSADRSRLLNEIVSSMRRSLKAEEILNITVSELRYALGTDRVIVYKFHDDWNGTIVAESVAAGRLKILGETVQDPFREGMIDRYKHGRVRFMNDILTENLTQCHQEILENFQIRASIVAPILRNKHLIGLLCAHECGAPRQWEEEEIDLFTQLAIQLGFALDQAALLDYTERARQEARQEADLKTEEQRQQKEFLQRRATELLKEVEPISKGDLTVRASVTTDEVGTIAESYNTIIKSLREIVEQVQTASQSVNDTASENESLVATLSQGSRRQMKAIHEALGKIQVMVESIQGVAERAKRAEKSMQIATQKLQIGDEVMNHTVSGISVIRETVSETSKKVKRLGEASQKISKVVSLINGFASQTNLLALNAAVEASRAGEDAKGFRVVADEVRTLAQHSALATAEISQLVEEIQGQTNEVIAAMEVGTEHVVSGTQLVEASRQQLSQINDVSRQVNQLVREISQAAVLQTETSNTVSKTMQQVAAIADQTSKQSDKVAESFGHLVKVAQDMQVNVAQFKVKE